MSMDLEHGFQIGSIIVEPLNGYICGPDQKPRHLPPKAMEVLVNLAASAPETVTREQLLDRVWGTRHVSDEVLTHAITELRQALGDDWTHPHFIQTIPKRGYRLVEAVRPVERPGARASIRTLPASSGHGAGVIRRYLVYAMLVVAGIAIGATIIVRLLPGGTGAPEGIANGNSAAVSMAASPEPGTPEESEGSEAAELYLLAQSRVEHMSVFDAGRTEKLLADFLSIDPQNPSAWSLLGRVYYRQAGLLRSRPVQEGYELAREAIHKSLALDPRFAEAYAELAFVEMTFDFDFDAAFRHLRQAETLGPRDSLVLRVAARMEMTHAHLDHAIDLLEQAVFLDPVSCLAHANLGQAYYFADRLDKAEQSLETSLRLNPRAVRTRYSLGLVRLAKGNPLQAMSIIEEEIDEDFREIGLAMVQHALGNTPEAEEALIIAQQMPAGPGQYHVGRAYAFRGQPDKALDWLEMAYEGKDGDLTYLLVDPLLAELRVEARWKDLADKLGLPGQI